MSEQQKMDRKRAAFEAWYLREIEDGQDSLIKYPNGHYINDTTMDAWYGWQARASLPVGVPDVQITGHLDEVDAPVWEFINAEARKLGPLTGSIDSYNFARPNGSQPNGVVVVLWNGQHIHAVALTVRDAMNRTQCVRLLAAPTVKESLSVASTVKAEQVDERDVLLAEARMVASAVLSMCDLETELSWMCERISKGRRIYVDDRAMSYAQAPSLPAAGSADQPYQDGIAEDLERSDWTPIEALQWYAAGKHFDTVGGRTRIIDTGAVASNALKHASLDYLELKGDAELSELRAALSAQQSAPDAPERVSVPVELAARLQRFCQRPHSSRDEADDLDMELRALLASHGRGEA